MSTYSIPSCETFHDLFSKISKEKGSTPLNSCLSENNQDRAIL